MRALWPYFKGPRSLPALGTLDQDLVDDSELLGGLGGHEVVALERLLERGEVPPRVLDVDLVQPALQGLDLLGVNQDVGRLPLEAARGLVDHDAGVRERETVAL